MQVCLLFLMDATTSMGSKIQLVKDKFRSIINTVKQEFENVKFKVAVIAYRDFDCGADHTEVLDFTGDAAKLEGFLER